MQQTEKYQFNLIETSDPFSPEPLNANMEKAEAALAGLSASRPRLICGSYTGTGTCGQSRPTILELENAERPPSLIFISELDNPRRVILIRGMPKCCLEIADFQACIMQLTWTDKGVRIYSEKNAYIQMNSSGTVYYYAILV